MRAFLDWPDCRNVRDLGTIKGIRPGALIRSDNLDKLTDVGIAAVHAANVSRIIDLRTIGELENYPNPFADHPSYLHRTLIPALRPNDDPPVPLLRDYIDLLRLENGRFVVAALQAIVDAPPGAVLVHCHAGKDRTGLIVGLALAVAGIDGEAIAADYALTAERLDLTPEHSAPEVIAAALADLGQVEAYLTAGGMTAGQLEALKDRLT
ncbi:tyrosine-protein phosphatase [Tenggerimyces flavus]|uniref:Tyrosine-protein phosphatase n=1 Tax=Tenggerimyces flavus TaxID=1708749 RepID=A0ABV7Y810_9ACTN|nr:tyrosine-protein phosphatase [Tenggerimyces flavus]MBM7785398.1 hypothetical protein [Tenggerimyces flavus]